MVKRLSTMQETWVRSLGQEDPLEKEMATHSSTIAWKIPWMEEPGRLQSVGSQRVGHDWVTSLLLSLPTASPGQQPPIRASLPETFPFSLESFPMPRHRWWWQTPLLQQALNKQAFLIWLVFVYFPIGNVRCFPLFLYLNLKNWRSD